MNTSKVCVHAEVKDYDLTATRQGSRRDPNASEIED